jgi:hypothetical protein
MKPLKKFYLIFLSILAVVQALAGAAEDSVYSIPKDQLVLNRKGQLTLPKVPELDNFTDYTPVRVLEPDLGGKIGFVDKKGKFVIDPEYDALIQNFQNGYAIVGNFKDSKLEKGVIDVNGKRIVPVQYDSIARISQVVFFCEKGGYFDFFSAAGVRLNEQRLSDFSINGTLVSGTNIEADQGVFDLNGKLLLAFQYKEIVVKEAGIDAQKYPVWQIMEDGNIAFSLSADSLQSFQPEVTKYYKNRYVGLLKGREILAPPVYSAIELLGPEYYIVKREQRYGLIDTAGNVVLPAHYDTIESTGHGSLVKLVSEKGESVFSPEKSQLLFRDETALHVLDETTFALKDKRNKWGIVDGKGGILLPFEYDSIGYKKGNLYEAGTIIGGELKMGAIDANRQWVVCQGDLDLFNLGLLEVHEETDSAGTLERKSICNLNRYKYSSYEKFPNGFIKVTNHKGRFGLINSKGIEVAEPVYDSLMAVADTLELFYLKKGKNIGLIDGSGEFVFSFKDDVTEIHPFYDGHAAIKRKGLYGFIDLNGNIRIAPKYTKCQSFSDGYAGVVLLGKWGFVDRNENIAVQPHYVQVRPMKKGVARVSSGASKWKFIDSTGKELNGNVYSDITVGERGRYLVYKNGKVGLAEVNGKELIVPRYDRLKDYGNGIIAVKKDGKAGFIDEAGNFTIPQEYENVQYDPINKRFFLQRKQEEKTYMELTTTKK